MKFKKKTIVSAIITICLLILIALIVKCFTCECRRCKQEGLQYYGDGEIDIDAPLAYRTVMKNIKYPITNEETGEVSIYDNGHAIHNSKLFNKENKRMHFSEQQIMKDLKHFNNSSNLLLDHYLNNNIPDEIVVKIQDASNGDFKTESITKTTPLYLYQGDDEKIIKTKTYLYRVGEHNNQIKSTDGICLDAYNKDEPGRTTHMINCDLKNPNQRWSYNPSIKQIKVTTGICLDAPQQGSAGKAHLVNCDSNNNNQHWNYDDSTKQIKSAGGYCLHASDKYTERAGVTMEDCDDNSENQKWEISGPPELNNGMYLFSDIVTVDDKKETDNIYKYNYDLSGLSYGDIYTQLTGYVDSSFNDSGISMIKPGKYSSHYFESNYADLSDNVTKDFKHFYSVSHTIAGNGLFNKS